VANQTVSVSRNLDDSAIAGLLDGEQITLNSGAILTCDSDNRWSQQACVVGNLSIDATTGGKRLVDGRNVWQVPFSASTGNVPALGTAGTQNCTGVTSGATGEFLGIWATGEMTPRAAGGAMPTAGYVKFRSKVGTFTAGGETINLPSSATITATGSGKRSWIHFVAAFQCTATIPRLGTDEIRGDWYELGTTDGTNNQEFDYPFLDICNGIEVETSAGSGTYNIFKQAGVRWISGTATLSTDARGYYFGQRADTVTGTTTSGSAVVTTTATTQLVVGMPINAAANFANLAGYIVSINPGVSFTINTNANASGSTNFITWRNKLQLARTGTTTQGFLPPTGCKVRCANVKLSTSVSPWAGNILPTNQAERYEYVTTSAGVIVMDTVDSSWYPNWTTPYSLWLKNVAQSINFYAVAVGSTAYFERCVTSYENNNSQQTIQLASCYGGIELKECVFIRFSTSGNSGSITDCPNVTITDCTFGCGSQNETSRLRGNTHSRAALITRCNNLTMTRPVLIGASLYLSACANVGIYDPKFADLELGENPGVTNSLPAAIMIYDGCSNVYGEGFANYAGIANVHPYQAVLDYNNGSSNNEWRNVGTPSAPYDGGTVNPLTRFIKSVTTENLTLRRCYVQNLATDFGNITNYGNKIELTDCWGDGGDNNAYAGKNQTNKGCRWSSSNSGQSAVYGSHWEHAWTSTTAGRYVLKCNEPTTESAAQFTITAGTPKFTSTGNIVMPTLGDQFIAESPFFALGVTAGAATAPTLTGTNTGNFSYEFQYDAGSGYNGTWLTLNSGNWSGMAGITAAVGVRVKLRVTVTTANASNALTYIRMDTVTNSTDQQIQYPLPLDNSLTLTGLVSGSEVRAYVGTDPATATVLDSTESSGTSFAISHGYTSTAGYVVIRKADYKFVKIDITYTAGDSSIPIQQQPDRVYTNP
jgi:hypothetical protein